MSIDIIREAFEGRGTPHLDLKRNEDGSYRYQAAQMAFRDFADGWQAAKCAHQPVEPTFEQLVRVYNSIESNFRKFEHMLATYMNKPKRESVSLEQCAKAISSQMACHATGSYSYSPEFIAKVCLDAAGVRYTE